MTTMTRRVFALSLMLVMSVALVGCGKSSPFVGTWTLDKEATRAMMKDFMKSKIAEEAGEQAEAMMGMMETMLEGQLDTMVEQMNMTLTVNADGTFTAEGDFDGKESISGTWTEADGTATFDATGEEDDMTATISGESLRMAPSNKPEGMPEDFALTLNKSE